jgi:hypothetical protein
MKVAICFWGLCRSTDKTLESIQSRIFEPLQQAGIEFTVYLHTYTIYRPYTNIRAHEVDLQLKNTLWKLLKPTKYSIEDQDTVDTKLHLDQYRTHGDPWKDSTGSAPFSTLDNHIRALWSLHQVTKLWVNSGVEYTKILYVRPDVFFTTPLQIVWILHKQQNTVYIPEFQNYYGCNDRFAIGSPCSMKYYGSRFTEALSYSKTKPLHSEAFLFDSMSSKGYMFHTIPILFKRIRADGAIFKNDKDL